MRGRPCGVKGGGGGERSCLGLQPARGGLGVSGGVGWASGLPRFGVGGSEETAGLFPPRGALGRAGGDGGTVAEGAVRGRTPAGLGCRVGGGRV